eukprot:1160802-Pelagomonas_calceolata.AAC.3
MQKAVFSKLHRAKGRGGNDEREGSSSFDGLVLLACKQSMYATLVQGPCQPSAQRSNSSMYPKKQHPVVPLVLLTCNKKHVWTAGRGCIVAHEQHRPQESSNESGAAGMQKSVQCVRGGYLAYFAGHALLVLNSQT